jgi:hypothetical protein
MRLGALVAGALRAVKSLLISPPDCFELAVLELNDANAVPACGGTDQHRVFSVGEESVLEC